MVNLVQTECANVNPKLTNVLFNLNGPTEVLR